MYGGRAHKGELCNKVCMYVCMYGKQGIYLENGIRSPFPI